MRPLLTGHMLLLTQAVASIPVTAKTTSLFAVCALSSRIVLQRSTNCHAWSLAHQFLPGRDDDPGCVVVEGIRSCQVICTGVPPAVFQLVFYP